MKKNVAFTLISFTVLKWYECLSVQLPFQLLVQTPVQLLPELEANLLDQMWMNIELECRWNNLIIGADVGLGFRPYFAEKIRIRIIEYEFKICIEYTTSYNLEPNKF